MKQRSSTRPGMAIYLCLAAVFLLLPQLVVVVVSFSTSNFVSFPPPGYSIAWFEKVLASPDFMRPLWNSVVLGFQATLVAAALAVPASIALVRHRFPGARAMQAFLLSPLSLPALILAIGLLFFLSKIGLGNTYAGLLIGHVVIVLPYLVRTIVAVYSACDPRLEEAAYTLGANPLTTAWRVTFPMLRPALFAGGIFAFLISFDEVAVSLLLTNASSVTLPVSILSYLVNNYDPAVAAISVLKMAIVVVALVLTDLFYGLDNLTLPANREGKGNG